VGLGLVGGGEGEVMEESEEGGVGRNDEVGKKEGIRDVL
jgi:hypothetical protein